MNNKPNLREICNEINSGDFATGKAAIARWQEWTAFCLGQRHIAADSEDRKRWHNLSCDASHKLHEMTRAVWGVPKSARIERRTIRQALELLRELNAATHLGGGRLGTLAACAACPDPLLSSVAREIWPRVRSMYPEVMGGDLPPDAPPTPEQIARHESPAYLIIVD